MISNEDLINELKKRPQTGNFQLVKKFYEPMVRTVSKRYRFDKLESEAIVNKSLLKVINNIKSYKYESESKFFNWFYTIIRNTVFDRIREKEKERQKLNTVSKDERFNHKETLKDELLDENIIDLDNPYSFDEDNDENIDEFIDKRTANEYFNSYFDSNNIKTNKEMELIIKTLKEFTIEEQCCITMRVDNISMREIALFRNSNVVATKQYVSRLMKKFFKIAAEKLKINNHKELYENFKKQDKLSNPTSDIKRENTET